MTITSRVCGSSRSLCWIISDNYARGDTDDVIHAQTAKAPSLRMQATALVVRRRPARDWLGFRRRTRGAAAASPPGKIRILRHSVQIGFDEMILVRPASSLRKAAIPSACDRSAGVPPLLTNVGHNVGDLLIGQSFLPRLHHRGAELLRLSPSPDPRSPSARSCPRRFVPPFTKFGAGQRRILSGDAKSGHLMAGRAIGREDLFAALGRSQARTVWPALQDLSDRIATAGSY